VTLATGCGKGRDMLEHLLTVDEMLPGLPRRELPPAPSRVAANQRRRRARMREGRICLTVTVDEVPLVEALLVGGFLDAQRADDRGEIRSAVERLLQVLTANYG
jgi:hypothetical protein